MIYSVFTILFLLKKNLQLTVKNIFPWTLVVQQCDTIVTILLPALLFRNSFLGNFLLKVMIFHFSLCFFSPHQLLSIIFHYFLKLMFFIDDSFFQTQKDNFNNVFVKKKKKIQRWVGQSLPPELYVKNFFVVCLGKL